MRKLDFENPAVNLVAEWLTCGRINNEPLDEPRQLIRNQPRGGIPVCHDHLLAFLRSPQAVQLLEEVGGKKDPHSRFLTGMILSVTPFENLPPGIIKKLDIQETSSDLKIVSWHGESNCSRSEPYLTRSIENRKTTLINDCLLIKADGLMTALCIQSTATKYGTLLAGSWYTPFGQSTKEVIQNALEFKAPVLTLEDSTWYYMRDSSKFKPDTWPAFLKEAQDHAYTHLYPRAYAPAS